PEIRDLEKSLSYYAIQSDKLSTGDLDILSKAYSLYDGYCKSLLGYEVDPRIKDVYSFQKYVNISEINDLISKLSTLRSEKEGAEEEKKEIKKPEQEATSIPPELESMVAEYRQNQADLATEEIKSNSQKTVAQQVKIAIAHKKRNDQVLANKERRQSQGEKFQNPDETFVKLGSPKSSTKIAALATSYDAVKKVAFTYGTFSKLPSSLQNEIISSAVELNTVGVSDIYTAIQASTLQINTSNLDETVKKNLATIPGGFVSFVYQEIVSSDNKTHEYESKITANEEKIIELQKQGKTEEIKSLVEENQHLEAFNESESIRLSNLVAKQTESFQKFEASRKAQLSKDPDLLDRIELANQNISTIYSNLENNGVKPHLFTPMDDADLLEQAIRKDLPGTLRPNAGYEAEYAAAIVSNPKTQNANLSPQAILLVGKELTPNLLAHAREYATKYPKSSLGKLYQARKDLFDSTGVQIRKIVNSSLGKEISHVKTDISNNIVKPSSNLIGKISDKAGALGGVLRVAQDPLGSLRSWAGRKAGGIVLKRLMQSLSNETLKKGAETLLKNGLKESVKKLAAEAATKAAIKLGAKVGTKIALETAAQAANVVPGLGILLAVAIEVIFFIGDKVFGALKKAFVNISKSIYGEEIKGRDLLAIPVAGVTAVAAGVGSTITVLTTSTVAAAGSAAGILIIGTFAGIILYITSVVTAPLISTLVHLESTPIAGKVSGCANIENIFLSQRDPSWSRTLCPNGCNTGSRCTIGNSGCGTASVAMIINSFGGNENVVDLWNQMHTNGGYHYDPLSPPYNDCSSFAAKNIEIMQDRGLSVTDIGYSFDEASQYLSNCGLIFALGMLHIDCSRDEGCGHFLVIVGIEGDQYTTMDPWSGENYVHTNDTFTISRMWGVVPQ
ncbi:MAG TPA: C39 family peptidase, partial [Spirochaetia bacterium]|nr:C39 family peptidase [Spirochaetia bacterium]